MEFPVCCCGYEYFMALAQDVVKQHVPLSVLSHLPHTYKGPSVGSRQREGDRQLHKSETRCEDAEGWQTRRLQEESVGEICSIFPLGGDLNTFLYREPILARPPRPNPFCGKL